MAPERAAYRPRDAERGVLHAVVRAQLGDISPRSGPPRRRRRLAPVRGAGVPRVPGIGATKALSQRPTRRPAPAPALSSCCRVYPSRPQEPLREDSRMLQTQHPAHPRESLRLHPASFGHRRSRRRTPYPDAWWSAVHRRGRRPRVQQGRAGVRRPTRCHRLRGPARAAPRANLSANRELRKQSLVAGHRARPLPPADRTS